MYKVIVADDEKSVRERVANFVRQMSDDFVLVGEYENGYDALAYGIPLEPDLVVTDIKMPFVGGLELVRQGKSELPLLQAIIVSGYDSFDYAKEAIELGVVGYISKPILFSQIKEAMLKAKDALDKNSLLNTDIDSLLATNEKYLDLVQNDDLNRLTMLKELPPNFVEKLKSDGILLEKPYVGFACFDADCEKDELSYEQSELIAFYLRSFAVELFPAGVLHFFENEVGHCLLLESDQPSLKGCYAGVFSTIIAKIKKTTGVSISVGVSDCGRPLEDLTLSFRRLFRHTKFALEYRTVMGSGLVLYYEDLCIASGNSGKIDDSEYSSLAYAILYGKQGEAKEICSRLIDTISKPDYASSYMMIANTLLDVILRSCVAISDVYKTHLSHASLVNALLGCKSSEALKSFFLDLIKEIISINESHRLSKIDEAVDHIFHYIEANYTKFGLSLDDVGKELGYSISYVSSILKQKDTSFTKYLTKIRMEKARALMMNGDVKIASVASMVGYEDPYYFSHCFKKYYGVSPMEFRKS